MADETPTQEAPPDAAPALEEAVAPAASAERILNQEEIDSLLGFDVNSEQLQDKSGVRAIVKRLRTKIPGVRVFMATLTSSFNSTNGSYGTQAMEEKRHAYNQFIRTSGIFDGVVDFDAATFDAKTGELKAEFQPNSSVGGPGDRLHPNRAGYQAMGLAIDPKMIAGK